MRIAVVGDVHRQYSALDSELLDRQGCDLICFVGDLPDSFHRGSLDVARAMAKLRTAALLIPGNHDGPSAFGVLAEAIGLRGDRPGQVGRAQRRLDALQRALGPVTLVGWSTHIFADHDVSVVGGRPFAMGTGLSFAPLVRARHGVGSLSEARDRLVDLVSDTTTRYRMVLAHNGPAGLGEGPAAPFTNRRGTDRGDPDLSEALERCARAGRPVDVVMAGHLHHPPRALPGRPARRWHLRRGPTTYINAARVPRLQHGPDGNTRHHHVEVTLHDGQVHVRARELTVPRDLKR